MKACGIITEYNPLHNGHIHHIKKAKERTNCDVLINVMSGNFVQRGEPAIVDKWTRAIEAIKQGCDLVIELPLPYAIQSAQQFAYGAIETLKLAQVDTVVFGSETNDLNTLSKLASSKSEGFHDLMKKGLSPVKAYEIMHGKLEANDILGIHYLKALNKSTITPYTIKRIGGYHDSSIQAAHQNIVSATAIRNALYANENISKYTPMNIIPHANLESYYPIIRYLLLTTPVEQLKSYALMDEGIENWLIKHAKTHNNWKPFLNACITKRYTASRIKRTLLHLLLQIKKNTYPINHIRILAFNTKGKAWLKKLKKETFIVTQFSQLPDEYRKLYEKSSYLYAHSEINTINLYQKEWQSAKYLSDSQK